MTQKNPTLITQPLLSQTSFLTDSEGKDCCSGLKKRTRHALTAWKGAHSASFKCAESNPSEWNNRTR